MLEINIPILTIAPKIKIKSKILFVESQGEILFILFIKAT